MPVKLVATSFFLLMMTLASYGQQPDSLLKKLDSLAKLPGGKDTIITAQEAYNKVTRITFPAYFKLLGTDLKQSFTKPFHMHKKDWQTLGKFTVVAGIVALADKPIQRFALKFKSSNPGLQAVSSHITDVGGIYETYLLGALAVYGYAFKNEKIKTTSFLASQAYITAYGLQTSLKVLTGRQRPFFTDSSRVEANPTFHGPFYKKTAGPGGRRTNSSFPSGHTTLAFAAATVYALEYKDRPIIPILAYSAASLVGLSRITENRHWATDVLAGAALGYLTGKLVVTNYHRYAKLKSSQRKNTLSFQISYGNGQVLPGLVYRFR